MPSHSSPSDSLLETVRRVADTVVPPTDEQLWECVRADLGDLVALTELYRRWRSPLALLAQQQGIALDLAEEVVNDAFVRLLRRRDRIGPIAKAFAYLRRCVERACWRAGRAQRKRAAREVPVGDIGGEPVATDADPVSRAEVADAVIAALGRLSDRQRLAAELHYLFGWTEGQVAEAIGVKPSTVKEHLDRARQKLRESLARWNPSAAAGGIAVGGVLADATRSTALPPERLHAAVRSILAQVAAPAPWGKSVAVLAAVVLAGGLAVAGQSLLADRAPPPPLPITMPAETLQAKNLRLFHDEVKPKLVGPLATLTLGKGGTVHIADVQAFDTRLECLVVARHGEPLTYESKLNVMFDTHTRRSRFRLDFLGNGQWRGLDITKPIYWDNPFSGQRVVRELPALGEIAKAFAAVEWDDPRARGEAAAQVEALRHAAPSYDGVWYRQGDANRPIAVQFDPFAPLPLRFTHTEGDPTGIGLIDLKVGPDGRMAGVTFHHLEGVLSADGKRVDFPGTDEWWTREPTAGGK